MENKLETLSEEVQETTKQVVLWRRRANLALVGIIVVAVLAIGLFALSALTGIDDAKNDAKLAQSQADTNRQSQIRNCEASKQSGGIRYLFAKDLKREIEETNRMIQQNQNFDYSLFFPQIPKEQLNAIISQQISEQKADNVERQAEIKDVLDIDCSKLYPKVTSP